MNMQYGDGKVGGLLLLRSALEANNAALNMAVQLSESQNEPTK